jgi:hypothetical protein
MSRSAAGLVLVCACPFMPVLGVLAGAVAFWVSLVLAVVLGLAGGFLSGHFWAACLIFPAAFGAAVLAAYTWPPPEQGDPDWSTWLALMVFLALVGVALVAVGAGLGQRALRGTTTNGHAARRMSRRDTPPSSTRRTGP